MRDGQESVHAGKGHRKKENFLLESRLRIKGEHGRNPDCKPMSAREVHGAINKRSHEGLRSVK